MTTNTSEKVFLVLTIIFVLILGNIVLVSAQSEKSTASLRIEFSPSKIEQTEAEHKIGYVWFENKAENAITTPNNITVKLESSNPEIVSVSDTVTIPAGQEYATFSVNTHGIKGQAKIFATYNDHSNFAELSVGEQDFTENDLRLVINLAAGEMNVESQMPFSFYLINSEGKITQAPFDVPISMEYEENLITVEISKIRKDGKKLIDKIKDISSSDTKSTTPTFRIIQGIENITSQIERMLENNTNVFYLVTTLEDVSKLYHTTIPEKIKQTERNGGSVRLVVDEIPDKMKLFIKRFGASEVRIGKLPSKGRIAVSKSCPLSGKLLMSDSAIKGNLHENTDAECALFTNSDEMTDNIHTLCTFIWKSSTHIEL